MPDVFLTATSAVLPGAAVDNDDIESVLGHLGPAPSRLRGRILRNNGIRARHYAIDRETGRPTHDAAQLAAEAVRAVCANGGVPVDEIGLLACGTSVPEHLTPGHASMVHGRLGSHPCEIASTHGVCTAGIVAMKYAANAVRAGDVSTAVATGTERCSSFLRASYFASELRARTAAEEEDPYVGFDQEFLRYMLSDGSGAVLLRDAPGPGLSFRVEWIDLVSFANELPTCMYMGGERDADGGLRSWRDAPWDEALRGGELNLHQDVRLLGEHMVAICGRALRRIAPRRGLRPEHVQWLLPHYSSEFFRAKTHDEFERVGFPIPYARWCSNLVERGNTGSASIFVMLDDFARSGRARPGDGVLLLVPESGRFACAWALLRVV